MSLSKTSEETLLQQEELEDMAGAGCVPGKFIAKMREFGFERFDYSCHPAAGDSWNVHYDATTKEQRQRFEEEWGKARLEAARLEAREEMDPPVDPVSAGELVVNVRTQIEGARNKQEDEREVERVASTTRVPRKKRAKMLKRVQRYRSLLGKAGRERDEAVTYRAGEEMFSGKAVSHTSTSFACAWYAPEAACALEVRRYPRSRVDLVIRGADIYLYGLSPKGAEALMRLLDGDLLEEKEDKA